MMMKVRATILACALLFAMASHAHEGNTHVMGTVTSISANSITVQSAGKEAKTTTVSVIPSTMFMKSGAHVSLKDLKVGDRVVVEAKENKDDKLEAVSVTFGKPQPHSGMTNMPGMDMPK
jgi:ribosomal protein S1